MWPETDDRFIAFFDIMGFKDFVFRNDHQTVRVRMEKLRDIIIGVNDQPAKDKDGETSIIKTGIFSDSIIIVTDKANKIAAAQIVIMCEWFLAQSFRYEIPVKGALAYGTLTADFDKSLFFGKPLIDAYLLQEELNMYGCIVHNSMEAKLKSFDSCYTDKLLIRSGIPMKAGKIEHFAINWTTPVSKTKLPLNEYEDILSKFYLSTSGSPRKYVDNSIDFLRNNFTVM